MTPTLVDHGRGVVALDVSGSLGPDDPERLRAALAGLPADARALVLVGGPEVFNSGATPAGLADAARPITDYVAGIPRALLEVPVPTVAAFAGHAVGGGLLLGLWCDLAVFAADRLYGANFAALGFTPGMGATAALEEAFGPFLARELLYTGRTVSGAELRALGAPLPHVVPRAEVGPRAFALARDVAATDPLPLRLLRRTFAARRRQRLEAALLDEGHMHDRSFADPGIRARIADALGEGP